MPAKNLSLHERIGYTPKQAERLKHKLDLEVSKIEDAAFRLRKVVPDTDAYVEGALDEIREAAHSLKTTIDRRTRGRH